MRPANATVFVQAPRVVTVEECELAEPRAGELLIRTRVSPISPGSELTVVRGEEPAGTLWAATGCASLLVAAALGIYAASLLPRLFDSLDATVLAERITDLTVRELGDIARRRARDDVEPALKHVAKHGLEIASVMAVQGGPAVSPH